MQKDQFCNLTRDIHTPGLLLKFQVATYMQLVGWEWTIFDFFNSYLALGLGGIKQKNVLFIAEPQDDFFCFIPLSLAAKYWSIVQLGSSFGSSFFLFPMKVAGGNPQPLVTALCNH